VEHMEVDMEVVGELAEVSVVEAMVVEVALVVVAVMVLEVNMGQVMEVVVVVVKVVAMVAIPLENTIALSHCLIRKLLTSYPCYIFKKKGNLGGKQLNYN